MISIAESTNNEGKSPYDVAISSKHLKIIDYLLIKSLCQPVAVEETGELIFNCVYITYCSFS